MTKSDLPIAIPDFPSRKIQVLLQFGLRNHTDTDLLSDVVFLVFSLFPQFLSLVFNAGIRVAKVDSESKSVELSVSGCQVRFLGRFDNVLQQLSHHFLPRRRNAHLRIVQLVKKQ